MPVQEEASKVVLNGNGTQTAFSFSFKIFKAENIKVYLVQADGEEVLKTLGTDYTFSSSDVELGGTVTMAVAPLATQKVLIIRSIPLEQDADFRPVSGFPEEVITDSFDTSRMIDQDLQEQITRCVKVSASSTTSPDVLVQQVERIYSSIDNVDTVADNIDDVNTVADNESEIDIVAGSINKVNTVADNISAVNTVHTNITQIQAVYSDIAAIDTVAADISNVNAVANNTTNINAVNANKTNIDTVAGNTANITTVAGVSSDVTTVAGISANVTTVAGNGTNINTVATNIAGVNTCATNIAAIQAAPTAAANANIWAEGTDAQVQALGGQHSSKGWAAVSQQVLPPQAGQAGKYLKTDGTTAGWDTVSSYHPDIFSHQWCDHTLNNISWLRADTFSWQSGSVYVTAYNELVSEYNNASSTTETEGSITFKRTPKGYKIALATQETAILNKYNTDGIAWYYILDTANTRFKLPRTKFGFEGLRTNVGDDIAESLPNITGSCNVIQSSHNNQASGAFRYTSWNNKLETSNGGDYWQEGQASFNASRSSSTYQNNAPVQERATQMYLYFYVGEYAQSAIEQTAGITTEQLNNKVDINASNLNTQGKSLISGLGMPSSRYVNLTLGASGSTYTAPANGYYYLKYDGVSARVILENIKNGSIFYGINNETSLNYFNSQTIICCKKDDTIKITYANGTAAIFRFIYAEGEQ